MTANDDDSPLIPGYKATVGELIRLAVERSDNVATNELFDLVGRERATRLAVDRLGCSATRFSRKLSGSEPLIADPGWDGEHRNAHPASDAAALFAQIALGAFPGADFLHDCLLRQFWNDKLSRGLLPGDRFAHKTGDTDEGDARRRYPVSRRGRHVRRSGVRGNAVHRHEQRPLRAVDAASARVALKYKEGGADAPPSIVCGRFAYFSFLPNVSKIIAPIPVIWS